MFVEFPLTANNSEVGPSLIPFKTQVKDDSDYLAFKEATWFTAQLFFASLYRGVLNPFKFAVQQQ